MTEFLGCRLVIIVKELFETASVVVSMKVAHFL